MEPTINLITIITNQLPRMLVFYRDVLGFKVKEQLEHYVEFVSTSVRFALTTSKVMKLATGHGSYTTAKRGQAFELAFSVTSSNQVDRVYADLINRGATPIKPPENMPWNQRTAFFADPDGNIHEIFAETNPHIQ